jgi:hypothetical protein
MAIIAQKKLFGWNEIEELGDLDRLRLVLQWLPDEPLMQALEEKRGRGRNEYPVRSIWNTVIAGVVFGHPSVQSLRRELRRNAQLRDVCGLELGKGLAAVPPPYAYSRFLKTLIQHQPLIESMFENLVDEVEEELPDLGRVMAVDGKGIDTHARGRKREQEENQKTSDGRRDTDADWGVKTYKGEKEDGSGWETVKSWFGYKLHLVVDARYELPVAFKLTQASPGEAPMAHQLVDHLESRHPELLEGCEYLDADRGYDDGKLISKLWDRHEIKPVIDIRNLWKDGEETKVVSGYENIVYDYKGQVFCVAPCKDGLQRDMAYGGFEKDRQSLKYRCPACHYGYDCEGRGKCAVNSSVRIPLSEDRRVFTPLARSSYAWARMYKKRTAVERVNSRLDVSFGFEEHFVRGLAKMRLRCSLALCVMLAMALGRIRENQKPLMRSLVRTA